MQVLRAGDSLPKIVFHVDTPGSQEVFATVLAAFHQYSQCVNRKISNWHRMSCHHVALWAKLLIFPLSCRLAWKMEQGI